MAISHPKTSAPRSSAESSSATNDKASAASRIRAGFLLLLLVGVSLYAYRQYQWQRQLAEVEKLVERRALKSGEAALADLDRNWGKTAESHFYRARIARYNNQEDRFASEINRAALKGMAADRIKHEESLFTAQAGRLDTLNASWPDMLADPVEKFDESASSLMDGVLQVGNMGAAVTILEAWEKVEPDSFFIPYYRGRIARSHQDPEEARRLYELAYEKNNEYIPLIQEIGEINYVLLNPRKAIGYLETAIQEIPGNIPLQTSLAETYIAIDRFAEAAKLVEPFISAREVNSDARGMLGRAYLGMGENQKVIDVLLPLHQVWPDDIDTNRNLATAYNLLGNEERAEYHDKAGRRGLDRTEDLLSRRTKMKQEPNNAEHYYSVGHDLMDCVSRVEGQQVLMDCLQIDKNHVGAIKDLIRFYRAAGDQRMVDEYQSQLDRLSAPKKESTSPS